MTDLLSGPSFSRRQFFGISGAAVALLVGGEVYDFGREFVAQEEAWVAAGKDNETFLRENAGVLGNLSIGASFAPEQWSTEAQARGEATQALDWSVRNLGMRHIRLGLRWDRVERRPGDLDLRSYRPYIDYAISKGLEVCLNVGPIRTFRWPEDHVPTWVQTRTELPRKKSRITPSTPLAQVASDYLQRLLERLTGDYGPDAVAKIPMVQVENEPFYRLGEHEWELGVDYLKSLIRQTSPYFPRSKILITSAGRLNFGPVRDVFSDLMAESPSYRGRLVMGFDYHYKTPLRDSYPVVRYLDPITFARIGYGTCEDNVKMARDLGYGIEITEGQAEPYSYLTDPGNSGRDFRFMVLRCADRVLDKRKPSVLRVWGIEEMAKKQLARQTTTEHEAIFDLIRKLNRATIG